MAISFSKLKDLNPSFEVIVAPQPFDKFDRHDQSTVFLAGSIDVGKETNWQTTVAQTLCHHPITILDQFRADWDSSWKEDINFTPFREQVEWEINMREKAEVIAIYFGPEAKACISLLELGLSAHTGKLVVCCPGGFWKRGNVQIVCRRFGVQLVDSLPELAIAIVNKLMKG